jgi:hypothetical protein
MDSAIAETHLSVIVFVGDHAYKLKKPHKLPFADFSTREARRAACEREVALNRRLAPDAYLGVADVLGPDGDPCDHLVVMRRMPEERRLATLVTRGDDVDGEIRSIAEVLAAFHATAPCSDATSAVGTVKAVRRNWTDNRDEMRPFVGGPLDAEVFEQVSELASAYLDGRGPLFEQRIEDRRVRDGHGDLLADDVFCLDDGPRILDCLEFDDRLRYGDVVADVAFLAMDLEHLGRPDLAQQFLALYRDISGDKWPASLAAHYVAYRAQVRAKVACLRYQQDDNDAAAAARSLLDLALRHLRSGRIMLVLIGGLPGSGKSTLASALAESGAGRVLRSDVVRKERFGLTADAAAAAPFGQGLYRPDEIDHTYRDLLERAGRDLQLGKPVVLDASWTRGRHRDMAQEIARSTSSDLVELECTAPTSVRDQRLAARRHGDDASDADAPIGRAMAAEADPWPSATAVDTTVPVATSVTAALQVIDRVRRSR